MKGILFTPNSVKGVKPYEKNGAKKKNSLEGKKRTEIAGAIKTADEVESRLEKAKKGTKAQGKDKSREKGGDGISGVRGVRQSKKSSVKPHKITRTVGENNA